jgi:hypothetical protein
MAIVPIGAGDGEMNADSRRNADSVNVNPGVWMHWEAKISNHGIGKA